MRKLSGGNDVVCVIGTDMHIICNISASENKGKGHIFVTSPCNVISDT